jgi:hypothetical protein
MTDIKTVSGQLVRVELVDETESDEGPVYLTIFKRHDDPTGSRGQEWVTLTADEARVISLALQEAASTVPPLS